MSNFTQPNCGEQYSNNIYGEFCKLPKERFSPSKEVVNALINFSKSLKINRDRNGNQIEMVLN